MPPVAVASEPITQTDNAVPGPIAIVLTTSEADAKAFIYFKESSNNQYAVNANSGACGLGQALPCRKMGCDLSDYVCQDTYFTAYAINRYGSWRAAKQFWLNHNWW